MEQLKLAWVYRFWIVVGIVALMPIVSYFVDTRKLARNAAAQAGLLKTLVSGLETAGKGANPNEKWAEAVSVLKEELDSKVGVAHVDLYKKQVEFMTWPEAVKEEYVSAGEKGNLDPNTRITYQGLYRAQFNDLFKIVDPVDPKGKGRVQMDPKLLDRYVQPWAFESQNPPTVPQAWLAQEDIWLLRALVGVVARANKDSTKLQESAVKEILEIRIGSAAVDDQFVKSKKQLTPRGDAPAATTTTATARADGREIKDQLYRQIPVSMKLIVDQPRLLQVLAEFGNSEIPMQVKQVEFAEIPITERHQARLQALLGNAAKKTDVTQKLGSAPPKDDEFFQMAEIEVWAQAIFYNKPEKVKQQEEDAAKDAADKTKTEQAKAPTATPGGAQQ